MRHRDAEPDEVLGSGEDGKTGHENTASYGDDDKEMGQYLMFTDVGAGLTFTDVGAGQRHTCALINDGSVKCWGSNHLLGSYSGRMAPAREAMATWRWVRQSRLSPVSGPTTRRTRALATSISVGDYHACAITNNTTEDMLFCWGESGSGQLGKGNTNTDWDTNDGNGIVLLPDRGVESRRSPRDRRTPAYYGTMARWHAGARTPMASSE